VGCQLAIHVGLRFFGNLSGRGCERGVDIDEVFGPSRGRIPNSGGCRSSRRRRLVGLLGSACGGRSLRLGGLLIEAWRLAAEVKLCSGA